LTGTDLIRSRQTDNVPVPGHPGTTNAAEQANHNGGVLKFGPDGKLYLFMGDQGRRGWLQNLPNGPFLTAPQTDDTFGGPEPDNAHFTGFILRLNEDGTTPADNPFFAAGAAMGGEAGASEDLLYGHPADSAWRSARVSGSLHQRPSANDAFSELNQVVPGMGRMGSTRGAAEPARGLQADRNHAVRQRHATGSISADASRVYAGPRPRPHVHAARRRL
jgi:hypothetical protein